MKKVSIIVPVYNSQVYLKECADSLVNQTLEDIEIIFVNDGSTDGSLEILEDYKQRYPEKVVVKSKENGGQATARNWGIELAKGEYIGFVDSDDSVDCTMFRKLYETAKKTGSDFAECEYMYLRVDSEGNKKEIVSYGNVRDYKSKSEMFIDPLVSPWNKIFKADILKQNIIRFPEGVIYEDTAFFIKSIPYIKKTCFVPGKMVYHYLWPTSTMNANKAKRVGDIFEVLSDIIGFYDNNNFREKYKNELEYFCVKILLCSSLNRVAQVKDTRLRREFIRKTKGMIANYFPRYRKNAYFKRGKTGLYMRCINSVSMPIVIMLMRIKGMIR
ncbi:MAG: glycosyltransferase [Lachnospiraceae bacterium]|nr:glycosyltransferase [Lachnospiraceae bacterium]